MFKQGPEVPTVAARRSHQQRALLIWGRKGSECGESRGGVGDRPLSVGGQSQPDHALASVCLLQAADPRRAPRMARGESAASA